MKLNISTVAALQRTVMLLDIHMRAKVSDLGLSWSSDEELTHISSVAHRIVALIRFVLQNFQTKRSGKHNGPCSYIPSF